MFSIHCSNRRACQICQIHKSIDSKRTINNYILNVPIFKMDSIETKYQSFSCLIIRFLFAPEMTSNILNVIQTNSKYKHHINQSGIENKSNRNGIDNKIDFRCEQKNCQTYNWCNWSIMVQWSGYCTNNTTLEQFTIIVLHIFNIVDR